ASEDRAQKFVVTIPSVVSPAAIFLALVQPPFDLEGCASEVLQRVNTESLFDHAKHGIEGVGRQAILGGVVGLPLTHKVAEALPGPERLLLPFRAVLAVVDRRLE